MKYVYVLMTGLDNYDAPDMNVKDIFKSLDTALPEYTRLCNEAREELAYYNRSILTHEYSRTHKAYGNKEYPTLESYLKGKKLAATEDVEISENNLHIYFQNGYWITLEKRELK